MKLPRLLIYFAAALLCPAGLALAQQGLDEQSSKRKPTYFTQVSTNKTFEFDDCAIAVGNARFRAQHPATRDNLIPGPLHRVATDIEFFASASGRGTVHVEASTQRKVKLAFAKDYAEGDFRNPTAELALDSNRPVIHPVKTFQCRNFRNFAIEITDWLARTDQGRTRSLVPAGTPPDVMLIDVTVEITISGIAGNQLVARSLQVTYTRVLETTYSGGSHWFQRNSSDEHGILHNVYGPSLTPKIR